MIVEQLIFTFVSFLIFVYMFFRMIRRNDTSYVTILVLEAIGIALNFIDVLFTVDLNILFVILKYILSVILPLSVRIVEKSNITLFETINLKKAQIYLFFENTKKAKEILLNVIVKNNNSYYKVAELLDNLDKKDEASEMLFNLLEKKPDTYKASELLGEILMDKQMYKEAVAVYQDALKYNPLSYDLNYNLGITYTMLNDFQNAKICYEKAAEINSLAYNAKYSLAEIALIYKEIEEAEKKFLEAIEEDELSADAYYELSKISLIKGEKDMAIKYANTAIDIDSEKIVAKVKKDPIFIPIIAKLSIPFNLEKREEDYNKITKKERMAKEHLEEMSEITRHLSYNDIKLLRRNVKKDEKNINELDKLENENIEIDYQKEKHD